ncbi:unnamed protein product [Arabidopsis arenosa]|uniref:DUF1985 domain-containing protein n=1 Tax=Arabidopsis arenosa TaxID=38785 RepID=A0A8S2B489_ARAAE|nr:unnamed protein product [Arabidopsis arenosa]
MPITRRGASTSRSEPSCSRSEKSAELRSPKRRKQSDPKHSEIGAAVDDVMEDQVVEPSPENVVSDHEEIEERDEDEALPLQPESFFFSPEEYDKTLKISTRCTIGNTLDAISKKLGDKEMKWFRDEKQFKHVFHLVRKGKNKLQDHNASSFGSYAFVERVFGTRSVTVSDVEKMLESMEGVCDGDRLQVAVLFFLCTIVRGGRRYNSIPPFVLKIVNDLEEVKKFPWGRLTFEDTISEIDRLMKKRLNGKVKVDHLFAGFIVPLEVLAFECIPKLSKQFQEGDIISILQPSAVEEGLLLEIMERAEPEDSLDPIADAWTERLDVQQKKICWEDLHKVDVYYRGCGEGHIPAASHREEPQQDVPAASQKEEELLLPYLVKRMVKTEVAKAMKDVYKRLEKLEKNGVGGCFEKNGVDTFDDETDVVLHRLLKTEIKQQDLKTDSVIKVTTKSLDMNRLLRVFQEYLQEKGNLLDLSYANKSIQ